jgi:alkylhydroperoxidase family enzyme
LFGLKCSKNPQNHAEADYEKLRQHGLSRAEILEVIAMAGLAVYANILADATGM